MTLEEDVEVLRTIPLFAKIEPSKLKLLSFTSQRLIFNPGDSLFNQGDVGDALYIIVDGDADVLVNAPDGPITVASMGKNDFVGDIAVLLRRAAHRDGDREERVDDDAYLEGAVLPARQPVPRKSPSRSCASWRTASIPRHASSRTR